MADETFRIKIVVESKSVTKADKELKKLQKTRAVIAAASRRTAMEAKRTVRAERAVRKRQWSAAVADHARGVRSQDRLRTATANRIKREADKAATSAASIRRQADRLKARSAASALRSQAKLRASSARQSLSMRRLAERTRAADTSFQDFGIKAMGVGKNLGMMAVKAGIAATAVTALGVGAFAKAVAGVKDFNVNSRIAFDALTGNATDGARVMGLTRTMANEYGQEIQAVTGQFKKLLAAQFSIEQAQTFIKLGADLRAIGTDAEGVKSAIRAITQIKAKGRLQSDELLQLSEANISQELIFGQLQKDLGLDNADQVRKEIEAGRVNAETALKAIQGAILKKTGSKEAGEAGRKFADASMEAAKNRVKNSAFNLLGDVADRAPAGFAKLSAIGKDLSRFFDQFAGKDALAGMFETAINGLGALVKIGKAFFSGFVERFDAESDGANRFFRTLTNPESLAVIQSIAGSFASFALTVAEAGLAIAQFITSFQKVKEAIPEVFTVLASMFEGFGFSIAAGLANGIRSGIGAVIGAAGSLAAGARDKFKSMLGIRSPSKVFEGFGKNVIEGFDRGVQTPAVRAAAAGAGASGGGGAVGATNNFNMGGMSVNTEVNEASGGVETAAAIEQSAMGAIGQAFERMALSSGVAGAR